MEIPPQLKQKGIKFVLLEKGGKKPFQKEWQNRVIEFDNPELVAHLQNGGNYGVMGGGEKNLILIDFDDEKVQEEAMKQLPETFTVKTGSGMLHLYYFSNGNQSFKIFNENMDTLADVQGEGKQVVGPGSVHPNGNRYEIVKNMSVSFLDYAEAKAVILQFDKKPKKDIEPKWEKVAPKDAHIDDRFLEDVKRRVRPVDVLRLAGVPTDRNPTQCPFHASKGGKCLGFNDETLHCFHCDGSWNVYSFMMDYKKCSFKDALEALAQLGGLERELEANKKAYLEKIKQQNKDEYEEIKKEYVMLISSKEGKNKWGQASEMLVTFILRKMWIFTTKDDVNTEVWIYKDGIYVPQGKSEIKEFLRNLLGEFYSAFIYNLVMNKLEPDTYIDIDKFFKTRHRNEIPVQNGILNIETLQLTEFTPDKIFFNKMPVKFDVIYQCPKIDKFLSEVLAKEEDKKIFYEIVGFALLDEYLYEKAFMFHGEGRNGKGKTIELLKRLFGMDNCCSIKLSALTNDNFSLSELFGKRINLAGDIGSQDLKETDMFKSLTGRDLVSAKRKFLRDLHFVNYAKFVFACNELPMVYDLSKGFWDRWILLDFPYTFVNQAEYDAAENKTNLKIKDDEIIEKITTPEELSGLLNQALIALHNLKDNKGFSTTQGSEQVKTTWIRKSNSFIAFCWDNIEDEYDGKISKKSLRKKYVEYCKVHKIPPKSDYVIKKVLQETYGANELRGEYTPLTGRTDVWEGIRWKN